jgi:uroporphyrinogen decarboxylase
VDYYAAMARHVSRLGVDVFWTSDDYCDKRGPVMGPQRWRRFCLPGLERLIGEVKQLGKPFIKHCDGNIRPIIDDLVAAGIDAIDPIDTSAGVDLADMKARFGGRVAIKGGVPLTLLCDGDPRQVRDCVKRCLDVAGPEGYILSSTSDITASVKPENYAAMLEAWRTTR